MNSSDLIITLALVTLVLGLAVGLWQRGRASKAKRDHEHSSFAHAPGDLRSHQAPAHTPRQ